MLSSNFLVCLLLASSLTHGYCYGRPSAITYKMTGGRFGEQLLTYSKTKRLAKKHKLRLLYQPFSYSDQLMLSVLEEPYNEKRTESLKKVNLDQEKTISTHRNDSILYITTFYTQQDDWYDWNNGSLPKTHDEEFSQELKRYISPRVPLELLRLPDGMITVAVHVRKGGGYDKPLLNEQKVALHPIDIYHYVDLDFPLKFPPENFYIEQIKYLSELFNDQPMYIYLFTDDKEPELVAQRFATALNKANITFDYRKVGNSHDSHILEDFFSMAKFDYLIRPDSAFSTSAQLIGNFKIVICPKHAVWKRHTLCIDKVDIQISKSNI